MTTVIAEIVTLFPWIVVLCIFIGMACLQWRVINALDQALARAVVSARPAALPVHLAPKPPATPAPLPQPKPIGPFDAAPAWFKWALHEIGTHEDPGNRGAAIRRYVGLARCGAEGDAWCAIFANAALESSAVQGSRSAASQSYRTHEAFVQLAGPALGAITVFFRGAANSGLGHVGFYRGEDADHIWVLGGNEDDMVQIEALPRSSPEFGLIGYWWPKAIALPTVGAILMPSGSPTHVQVPPVDFSPSTTPGLQSNITATMFGGQKSAYGPPIDDTKFGVALPYRFPGDRPKVRVVNRRNAQVAVCDIVDVGPWNINDPYWQKFARPEAETGVDNTGRKTNLAGIDLTLAAAKALQIDGKGLVDWEFVSAPNVA